VAVFLAGISVAPRSVLALARLVDDDELAARLRSAVVESNSVVTLETEERQTLLRALKDPPPAEFADLRNTLLQEHERRRAGGH
jgi:hypothetical protein